MRSRKIALLASALLLCVPHFAQGQTVTTRKLSAPDAELPKAFGSVSSIRELSDGRLFVIDGVEKLVFIVDFARRTSTQTGRTGDGPGEYNSPGAALIAPGDTTIVSSFGGKYLRFASNGSFADALVLPATAAPAPAARMMMTLERNLSDSLGRIFVSWSRAVGPQAAAPPDSVVITRIDAHKGTVDSVAWLPNNLALQGRAGERGSIVPLRQGPFVTSPTWTVTPDGRVAVVTPVPYRVTWFATDGRRTVGQPIPFQQVRVTEEEKKAYRDSYSVNPMTTTGIIVPPSGRPTVTTTTVPYREPQSWPTAKDPYASHHQAVLASATSEIWILKQLPHTDSIPTYDVIGARGELTGRVTVPVNARVVGFGRNGAVYIVRRDADDLEYLQRFRLR